MEIHLNILATGETITLNVEPNDRVESIKTIIHHSLSI